MKFLIVGGDSVFSQPLAEKIISSNPNNEVIVTHNDQTIKSDKSVMKNIYLDLRDAKEVKRIVENAEADVIFDIESQTSVGYAWKNPKETVDINVLGTINLLDAIKELKKKTRLIIGGSGEEYGNQGFDKLPVKESFNPNPVNIFGATKVAQTMFTKLYAKAYGLDVIVLRTFNEISALQDDKWAIPSICRQFVRIELGKQEPIIHIGNAGITRDFTDVDDLVRAFECVALKGKSGEIYNAASGRGLSIAEIICKVCEITGLNPEVRCDRSRVRPMDVPSVIADVSKIYRDTGWKAEIDINETLKKMVERWRYMEQRGELNR